MDEIIKLENKMAFHFRNTKKAIIMTHEDGEHFRKIDFCRFCEEKNSN